MINNKKLNPVVVLELFIRGTKLNISIAVITQSYFKKSKDVRLNSTDFFIMKIPNKRELQQLVLNHSSDKEFKNFMNLYKKCTAKPYSFLVIDDTLAWNGRHYQNSYISWRFFNFKMKLNNKKEKLLVCPWVY